MYKNELLDRYKLNIDRLGKDFIFENNKYYKDYDIADDLYVRFIIDNNSFEEIVYDRDNYEYIPFSIKDSIGNYIGNVRNKVSEIEKDILDKYFDNNYIVDEIVEYVKDRYNAIIDNFMDSENIIIKNKDNNKWIGIIMNVSYKSLNIDKDGKIWCMNLKNNPDIVIKIIDNVNYLPGYHMNKKHWFTIVLDNNIHINDIVKLIDDSYKLVSK